MKYIGGLIGVIIGVMLLTLPLIQPIGFTNRFWPIVIGIAVVLFGLFWLVLDARGE